MTCDRLEAGGLLGSLGEAVDPHVAGCADCRARWASYGRIAAALARESGRSPPGDWMDRMQARLATDRVLGSSPDLPVIAPERKRATTCLLACHSQIHAMPD